MPTPRATRESLSAEFAALRDTKFLKCAAKGQEDPEKPGSLSNATKVSVEFACGHSHWVRLVNFRASVSRWRKAGQPTQCKDCGAKQSGQSRSLTLSELQVEFDGKLAGAQIIRYVPKGQPNPEKPGEKMTANKALVSYRCGHESYVTPGNLRKAVDLWTKNNKGGKCSDCATKALTVEEVQVRVPQHVVHETCIAGGIRSDGMIATNTQANVTYSCCSKKAWANVGDLEKGQTCFDCRVLLGPVSWPRLRKDPNWALEVVFVYLVEGKDSDGVDIIKVGLGKSDRLTQHGRVGLKPLLKIECCRFVAFAIEQDVKSRYSEFAFEPSISDPNWAGKTECVEGAPIDDVKHYIEQHPAHDLPKDEDLVVEMITTLESRQQPAVLSDPNYPK